jgi:hypothetical protein
MAERAERAKRERISVTRRISDLVLREGGFVRIWLNNLARGSGCCCGACVAFVIFVIVLWITFPVWGTTAAAVGTQLTAGLPCGILPLLFILPLFYLIGRYG